MTTTEARKLLNLISATYTSFAAGDDTPAQWAEIFGSADFNAAKAATVQYIRKNQKGFAPTPGEILALMPKGASIDGEEIQFNADGAGYTIKRGSETHIVSTASDAEKWAERKAQFARGYGYCVEKRPRGWATWYAPLNQCIETGRDMRHGESLSRHRQA